MNAAEIFVEQLFVGGMVVMMLALPFLRASGQPMDDLALAASLEKLLLVGGSIAAGAAYLLGVVADRIADTLCEGIDKRQRAEFAIDVLRKRARPGCVVEFLEQLPDQGDPFPEGKLRYELLKTEGGVREYAEYLRSRIRLSRSTAVFLPGIAFGWSTCCGAEDRALVAIALLALAYGGGLAWALVRDTTRHAFVDVPKTCEIEKLRAYAEARKMCRCEKCGGRRRRNVWLTSREFLVEPVTLVGVVLTIGGIWHVCSTTTCGSKGNDVVLVVLIDLLAVVSLWAWRRISRTQRSLLLDLAAAGPSS